MKLKVVLVAFVVAVIRISSGLRCLECSGVSTEEECTSLGEIRECEPSQDACEIELRRHEGWNGELMIFKHCKQSWACQNNKFQNPRAAWLPIQCNPFKFNSVCRCCCYEDMCNVVKEDCFDVQCPRPQHLRNGWYTCTKSHSSGSVCRARCHSGYVIVGPKKLTCQNDESWDTDEYPVCRIRGTRCRFRGNIRNGDVSCTNGADVGSACQAVCDEGFDIVGPADSICLSTGFWSKRLPICTGVTCPRRGRVIRGDVSCTDSVNVRSICTAICDLGSTLIGTAVSECLSSVEWSARLPVCQRVVCPDRGAVDDGVVTCSNGKNVGSICNVRCEARSQLVGRERSACLPTGEWDNSLPSCRIIQCGPRGSIENGEVTCSRGNRVGSDCDALCNEGFRPVGPSSSTCLSDGEWNRSLPVCRPQLCRDQGDLKHGSITCTDDVNVQSVCSFQCEREGFIIFPEETTTNICQPNQTWSTPKPCCARNCPPHALLDVVILLDSSSSIGNENWKFLTDFVRRIIRSFDVSQEAVNFAIFRYNTLVDTASQIFLDSYADDVDGLVEAFGRIPYEGSGTFTGLALRHVIEVSLAVANGNRPDVKDVVLLFTDGRAADDVLMPAAALRENGATILVVAILPLRGKLDFNELEEITGNPENVIVAADGFAGLDVAFSRQLSKEICGNPCE